MLSGPNHMPDTAVDRTPTYHQLIPPCYCIEPAFDDLALEYQPPSCGIVSDEHATGSNMRFFNADHQELVLFDMHYPTQTIAQHILAKTADLNHLELRISYEKPNGQL